MSASTKSSQELISKLHQTLQHKVPNACLKRQTLPLVPEIQLDLIDDNYPQDELSPEQVTFLMDEPPYWAFCWASGQVMARYLLDNAHLVKDRSVIDFGCGSGIVAIAAKIAGAQKVLAVDSDPAALLATQLNSRLNKSELTVYTSLENCPEKAKDSILLIADVFYDPENIPMLSEFIDSYADVIIADSRVKYTDLPGVLEVDRYSSCTVPDLDESSAFNSVGIYRVKRR